MSIGPYRLAWLGPRRPGGPINFCVPALGRRQIPLGQYWDGPVCATVQNQKRAGTKIFFIGVTIRTYGDFGGWGDPFFCADSCNTALCRGTLCPRIVDSRLRGKDMFMNYETYAKQSQLGEMGNCAKQSQFGATGKCAKQTQFATVRKVHHRGTEITEASLDSLADMTSISFSVASVSLWWIFVRNEPNLGRWANAPNKPNLGRQAIVQNEPNLVRGVNT
jgi:hypothetical protein